MYVTRMTSLLCLSALGMLATTALADITTAPDPLVLNGTTTTGDIIVTYTGATSMYGYSIDVQWDNNVASAAASDFTRPDNGPFASTAFFFVIDIAPGHVRIDASLEGADPGITSDELFKATFAAATSGVDQTDLDLTIVSLRDPSNAEITGVVEDDGLILVDTSNPVISSVVITNDTLPHTDDYLKDTDAITVTATVTDDDSGFDVSNITADLTGLGGGAAVNPDTYVSPTATWTIASATCSPANGTVIVTVDATDDNANMATQGSDDITSDNIPPLDLAGFTAMPGHEKIHLAWTGNGTANYDANFLGVVVRAVPWGDYPDYDTTAPSYPADAISGTGAIDDDTGLTSTDWGVTPRDIYYLAGFVYDQVLHTSAVGANARATNYFLGDVMPVGYDGYVQVLDVDRLGDTYGLPDTDGAFDAECNVGPTDTDSPRAIPQPNDDNEVGFEDLMIFALNFGVVTPSTRFVVDDVPVLAWQREDDTTWVLRVVAAGDGMQGLNLAATLPAGVTCEVQPGSLLQQQNAPTFLRNIPQHGLDAGLAAFGHGVGISGTGDLIKVTLSEPVAALGVAIDARDLNNESMSIEMSDATAVEIPAVASFAQNYPNPFNPQTTLAFALPQAQHVTLAIYGLAGTRVRTLVDEPRAAGGHTVIWNGRDDAGRVLATGTYFAKIDAGDFHQIRKMVLMK